MSRLDDNGIGLAIDPGFDPRNVLNVSIPNPAELGYSEARTEDLHRALQERLSMLRGVALIATASRVPLGNAWRTSVVPIGDGLNGSAPAAQFPYTFVSPEYFQTLRIPFARGRAFTAADVVAAAPIVIVSEALARPLWPSEDVMGKHLAIGTHAAVQFQFQAAPRVADAEIVGIVRDVYSVSVVAPDQGAIYLPRSAGRWESSLLVRADGSPQAVASSLIAAVRQIDPKLGVSYEPLEATMRTNASYVLTLHSWPRVFASELDDLFSTSCVARGRFPMGLDSPVRAQLCESAPSGKRNVPALRAHPAGCKTLRLKRSPRAHDLLPLRFRSKRGAGPVRRIFQVA